jgi:hypothetical protein
MADILCALFDLLWTTSTRWYQLLSAGNTTKHLFIWVFSTFFSTIIPHLIGGVYGGASTIRARLLPFLNVEQSYLNGLISNSASDLYPLAWWRYPYSHLHTDSEFRSLAHEYESNLAELDADLRLANNDNVRLEIEYIKSDLFFSFLLKGFIFSLDLNKHGLNWLMNGLNQQMKNFLPVLNYLIYEHGK